jgi:hypothetical protein
LLQEDLKFILNLKKSGLFVIDVVKRKDQFIKIITIQFS